MPKRILQGVVVGDKNEKTVVVRVERRFAHPLMQKTVRRSKKYKAHDENNQYKIGEDRSFIKSEFGSLYIEHRCSGDVGWHQIRRELNSRKTHR